jgi:hypothetical protein
MKKRIQPPAGFEPAGGFLLREGGLHCEAILAEAIIIPSLREAQRRISAAAQSQTYLVEQKRDCFDPRENGGA